MSTNGRAASQRRTCHFPFPMPTQAGPHTHGHAETAHLLVGPREGVRQASAGFSLRFLVTGDIEHFNSPDISDLNKSLW